MNTSAAFVALALSDLGCSQKELANKLGVSPTQITKWKNGEHISMDMEEKFRELLDIESQTHPALILALGGEENVYKWNVINSYIHESVEENSETGYMSTDSPSIENGYGYDFCLGNLIAAGAPFPKSFPEDLLNAVKLIQGLDLVCSDHDGDAERIDEIFEKSTLISLIFEFWNSFDAVYGFYAAYLQPLIGYSEDCDELICDLEGELFELALIKCPTFSDKLPLYEEFKNKNYNVIFDRVRKIKQLAKNEGVYEKVNYLDLLTANGDSLGVDAEREALGFNEEPTLFELQMATLKGIRVNSAILQLICQKVGITEKDIVEATEEIVG